MSDRLKEIRERAERSSEQFPFTRAEVTFLLTELERVTAERDEARRKAKMEFGELLDERDSLRSELSRVERERDELVIKRGGAKSHEDFKNSLTFHRELCEMQKEYIDRLREALAHAKKVIDYHAACAPEHLKEISRIEAGGDGKG